tara:strand:- start:4668 stop:6890 length:2223 start_codon:yes stop_codon:yes gene_type:complete
MNNNIDNFDLVEKYNIEDAEQLILSSVINEQEKNILKKYIKNCYNGSVKITYQCIDYGRLKCKINGGGISQMMMPNIIKRNILNSIYSDVDMSNCHPEIFYQLCCYYKLPINNINYLIQDNLIEILKNNLEDKNDYKKLKCKLLYGGNIQKYGKLFINIQNDIKKNTNCILKFYPEILKQGIRKKNEIINNNYNIEGCALSYLIQQVEKLLSLKIIDYFSNSNINVGAYIFDGIHVEGNISAHHILNCEKYIKNETPFNIKLKIKPFNKDDITKSIIVNNDVEASHKIINTIPENHLIFCNGRIFFNYDNIYIDNNKIIDKFLLRYIFNMNIYKDEGFDKNGSKKYKTLSKDVAPAEKLLKAVKCNIDVNENFYKILWNSNLQKLCYNNGYYDFKKRKFYEYSNKVYTTIKINKNYNCISNDDDIKLIYDKILNPIFDNNQELIKYFLQIMSRGIAGHVEDKNWILGLGMRNSGKGLLVNLFENCFEKYIMTTNSNNFIYKKSSGDEAKSLSWCVPTEFKRICFTNEMKIDAFGETKIDGNIIKKISSGGDNIQCRLNHQDEIEFKPQTTFVIMANDIPEISPTDAMKTCIEFQFPSQFVDFPQKNCFIKEYKTDHNIKQFITKDNIINAFTHILFSHYLHTPPKMIDSILKIKLNNIEEDDITMFKNLFIVTNNEDDIINISHFNKNINNNNITMSKKKIKKLLLSLGVTEKRKTSTRFYVGIKWINNDDDNNINYLDQ